MQCDKCGTEYEPTEWDVAKGEQRAHPKSKCIDVLIAQHKAMQKTMRYDLEVIGGMLLATGRYTTKEILSAVRTAKNKLETW